MFFGDSVAFAGSASSTGFVQLLDSAFPDAADVRVEGAGHLNFSLTSFVDEQLDHLFLHLTPSVAVFMVSDDELNQILIAWLQQDQRARHDVATCGTCDELGAVAKAMLAPLQLQLRKLLARVIEIAPHCRIALTTTLLGVYDPPAGGPADRDWHTEGYMREQYLRESYGAMLEQLSFDFSPPPELLDPAMEHYHGGYQNSRFPIEVWEVGHVIGRVREVIYMADAEALIQPSLRAHGAGGFSHHLDDVSHAALALAATLYLTVPAPPEPPPLGGFALIEARKSISQYVEPLLENIGISISQLASWQHDSQKAIATHMQSRSASVQQLRARDHAARLEEERIYMHPVLPEASLPGKIKVNKRQQKVAKRRRTKRDEL